MHSNIIINFFLFSYHLQSDEWTANPDELLDSFFSLNGDFLKELDESENIHFNELPIEPRLSPVPSSSVEPEFHGFLDGTLNNITYDVVNDKNNDVSQYINNCASSNSNDHATLSSSSSDSGLSSDNMEM